MALMTIQSKMNDETAAGGMRGEATHSDPNEAMFPISVGSDPVSCGIHPMDLQASEG
jgi:hypothetical protein